MSTRSPASGPAWDSALEDTRGRPRRSRHGKNASASVARALGAANERGASLGTGFLGRGAGVIAALQAMYSLSIFISHWQDYPVALPAVAAWVLYLCTLGSAVVMLSTLGEQMPHWSFALFVALLAGVVALDFLAIWPLHNIGEYASASTSAGFGLLLVLTLRGGRELLVVAAALAAAFITAIVLNTPLNARTIPWQVAIVTFTILPIVAGVGILRGFRRMVQVELDRVMVQSTVSAPRFAVGMLASEELARLDLAAEELLGAVASNRVALPLTPKTASVAASLATELRLHLIEGRRETWLYHAITESELLGKSVTLTDRGSLAGLLDPTQRDGLLSAVWLLVSEIGKTSATRTVQLTIGPIAATNERRSGNRIAVPIVITTTGVPRSRVDPATWESIRKIGRYSDSTYNSSLRLDIACLVDNPADH